MRLIRTVERAGLRDEVAVEEPLEIRVDGEPLAVAMRTPGCDEELAAGAPILVGVGAPTSLAVVLADDRGMTLCGFARAGEVNVYTHEERAV